MPLVYNNKTLTIAWYTMRTVSGIPECVLLNGRRFTATVTHNCEDADDAYIETTFVDVAPGRIDVLLRPHAEFTSIFSIDVSNERQKMFPRIYAWFSIVLGRPFAVPRNDVSIQERCMNIRIRGYFDTTFQIRFDESEFETAFRQYGCCTLATPVAASNPTPKDATNPAMHGNGGGQRFLKSKSTPATP